MSVSPIIRRLPIASSLFVLHTLLVTAFYVWWLLSSWDIERDMGWLSMAFIDFPVFFAYIPLVDSASGHLFALVSILFGGLEWGLVGFVFDYARRSSVRKHSLRGSANI